jgi:hypothetical protein
LLNALGRAGIRNEHRYYGAPIKIFFHTPDFHRLLLD